MRAIVFLVFTSIALLIAIAETVLALNPPSQVQIAWDAPTNAPAGVTYQVYLGTNSGSYYTNWTVSGTNTALSITNLSFGTNFLTVSARQVGIGTNAIVSEPSNEIQIYRSPAPRLRITYSLLSGTNSATGPWTDSVQIAETESEITEGQKFFAVRMTPAFVPPRPP